MQEPKETKPESPDALRRKEPGERLFDAISNHSTCEFGAWAIQSDRDKARWAAIETDLLASFGLAYGDITIPFPKPPTK